MNCFNCQQRCMQHLSISQILVKIVLCKNSMEEGGFIRNSKDSATLFEKSNNTRTIRNFFFAFLQSRCRTPLAKQHVSVMKKNAYVFLKHRVYFFYFPETFGGLVPLLYFSALNAKRLYHYGIWCSL